MSCSRLHCFDDASFCRSKPQIRFRFERCGIGIIAGQPFIRTYLSTVTRRRVGDPVFVSQQSKTHFSSLKRPYRLWSVPSLLVNGYWSVFPAQSMKLTTRVRLVPRLRMSGGIPLLPLYAFVSWTGKNLLIRWTGEETEILSEFLGFHGFFSHRKGLLAFRVRVQTRCWLS